MPTIYGTLLTKGYFPKELPPAFFAEDFARYATSKLGRSTLSAYQPQYRFTEPVSYRLALPGQGGIASRALAVPHPWAFSALALVIAKNFRRLLRKSGASKFSKSRPVYRAHNSRALSPLVKPSNLSRERAIARGGATHVLKVDVSQFYPSLYTHAIGWAVDKKLRDRKNWNNKTLLGKQIDQLLVNMQGKVSQGIPIGNDISFLLAEVVLAQIDGTLDVRPEQACRWFDDYEFACRSRQEAEELLVRLNKGLDSFRLRANPKKTAILELPQPVGDGWQDEIRRLSDSAANSAASMVSYFDYAFRARGEYSDQPVLLYAMSVLFKNTKLHNDVQRVAQSCITQAILSEPGCAQKAFALLSFWEINGSAFDRHVLTSTIDKLVQMHGSRGASSDLAWALAFCIQHGMKLGQDSGEALALLEDDAVAILSLHANRLGLLPGFTKKSIVKLLKATTGDGEHWLLLYESVRQGFLPAVKGVVAGNSLFADLLANGVSFYRQRMPNYSLFVSHGGAPEWIVKDWLKAAASVESDDTAIVQAVVNLINKDMGTLQKRKETSSDMLRLLLDSMTDHLTLQMEPYE
jgi:hypothetical protein